MRLLITGASGFIGKNLLLKVPKKWEVVATYNKSSDFPEFVTKKRLSNVEAVRVDLTNLRETREKIAGEFDSAIHLASNTDVQSSLKRPETDLQLNVVTFLNTVKAAKISDLIFMSSGAVYDGNNGLVTPKSHLHPSFPYAISKLACENYALYFRRHNLVKNYVILRFFGAYGPFELPRKIYTKLVRAFYFEDRREFTIKGDGNNFIDAMYINDAVDGILSVLRSAVRDLTVDFATGNPMTINALVMKVAEIFGKTEVTLRHEGWPPEYNTFYASNKDMEVLYGFKHSTSLEAGLRRLAAWLEKKRA